MALNFPDSPIAGTVFGAWRYDGTKWGAVSGVSGGGSAGDITAVLAGAGLSGGGTEGDVSIALAVPVTVARGGTGATDAATARTNLGAAPLAGPVFTGDPQAPTPATADNDTSIATTAYVKSQGYLTPPANLTSQVTGVLPVANGGSGSSTAAAAPWVEVGGDTMTGALTTTGLIVNAAWAALTLNKPASGTGLQLLGQTGGSTRWVVYPGDSTAEAGANSGSDFQIARFNDSGTWIDSPLFIYRSSGDALLGKNLSVNGNLLTLKPASGWAQVYMQSAAGQKNSIFGFRNTSMRWELTLGNGDAESGGNAGTNFGLARYNDAGAYIDTALSINRATGIATFLGETQIQAAGTANASVKTFNGSRSWSAGTMITDSYVVYDNTAGAARIQITTAGACWNQTGTWNAMSDVATKRDIQPYTRGLADLLQLEPVMFKYNGSFGTVDDGQQMYGLVAQQVEPYVPEIVVQRDWLPTDESGNALPDAEPVPLKGVDPTRLTYALLNALRELDERLRVLETPP